MDSTRGRSNVHNGVFGSRTSLTVRPPRTAAGRIENSRACVDFSPHAVPGCRYVSGEGGEGHRARRAGRRLPRTTSVEFRCSSASTARRATCSERQLVRGVVARRSGPTRRRHSPGLRRRGIQHRAYRRGLWAPHRRQYTTKVTTRCSRPATATVRGAVSGERGAENAEIGSRLRQLVDGVQQAVVRGRIACITRHKIVSSPPTRRGPAANILVVLVGASSGPSKRGPGATL